MSKLITVETTGDFMLRDPNTGIYIPHDSPSDPLEPTAFIRERIELGQLKIIKGKLDGEAPPADLTPPIAPAGPTDEEVAAAAEAAAEAAALAEAEAEAAAAAAEATLMAELEAEEAATAAAAAAAAEATKAKK